MYLLEEDGSRILLRNRGYSWYRDAETEAKFRNGEISHGQMWPARYYFQTSPAFEAPSRRKHDWLNRTILIGAGARVQDGNVIRYYKVV